MNAKLFLLSLILGWGAAPAAGVVGEMRAEPLETIVDVNFDFLMGGTTMSWGPDLFRKKPGFGHFTSPEEKYALQGIASGKTGTLATVDGRTVRIGDTLGERKVVEIGPNYVVLEKSGSQIQLVVPPTNRIPAGEKKP